MWIASLGIALAGAARANPVFRTRSVVHPTYSVFYDPIGDVNCKEFALFFNVVPDPDTSLGSGRLRELFHIVYQRSGGLQASETRFGHAWSPDLLNWAVDTAAFTVDTTA